MLPQRFWDKVVISPKRVSKELGFCWLWTGAINPNGYGTYYQDAMNSNRLAHRISFGQVPDGLEIDHLCRARNCVRPLHLEAVTRAENNRRAQPQRLTCLRGHPMVEGNINYSTRYGSTSRACRTCENAANRRRRAARKVN